MRVRSAVFVMLLVGAGCDAVPVATDAVAAADAAVAIDAPIDARRDAPDAGPLGCVNEPAPAVAADPIEVTGTVFAVVDYQVAPVAAATVELRRSDGSAITTAVTGDDGAFTISTPSGGAPLDGWFAIDTPGRLPTRAYPLAPLVGGEHPFLLVADATEVAAWYAAGGAAFATDARTVLAAAVDCEGAAAAGATYTVAPAPATLVYYDDGAMRWDPQLAASTNGYALATATAATITLAPHVGAVDFPTRTIAPTPGALTMIVTGPRTP